VWDRAAAPAAHLQRRVAAWYRADDAYGRTGRAMPAVVVLCPDERTLSQWLLAVERSAARRARDLLPIALAVVGDVAVQGPLAACWWRPGSNRPVALLDCLAWRTATEEEPPRRLGLRLPPPTHAGPDECPSGALRRRGMGPPPSFRRGPSRQLQSERWAALTIGLSATQKRLLTWVGHHPLLARAQLAIHLDLTERQIVPLLADLQRQGLVAVDLARCSPGPDGPRYVLTTDGAALLAARDGVPVGLYLTEGVIAAEVHAAHAGSGPAIGRAVATPVRLALLRRYWQHTVGVQRFALALAREAERQRLRGLTHRLVAWLNEAESQVWFWYEGRRQHIRPDGRFLYQTDGVVHDLLLEWDRGLVRRRDYRRKLAAYAVYVAAHGDRLGDRHHLVIVTTTAAEPRLRQVLDQVSADFLSLARYAHIVLQQSVADARVIADLFQHTSEEGPHEMGRMPLWTGNY
jgi:hypothetical protein